MLRSLGVACVSGVILYFIFMRVESAAPLTVAVLFVCHSYFVFEASLARECVHTLSGVVY